MPEQLELDLTTHEKYTKLRWRTNSGYRKAIQASTALLSDRSCKVRQVLTELNSYIQKNSGFDERRDQEWKEYRSILQRLRQSGRALRSVLFPPNNTVADEISGVLQNVGFGEKLKVYCSDEDVTLPLGFVYEGSTEVSELRCERPSWDDFAGFWLTKFQITMNIEGGGVEDEFLSVEPNTLRTLFAFHRDELENAVPFLGAAEDNLRHLIAIEEGARYDWDSTGTAWQKIADKGSIVFVFAHSDGDYLQLSNNSQLDCITFSDLLRKEICTAPTLLILNCCFSATGREGASLLSCVARRGFCGLIGTEAEVLNTYALRCGTYLMWTWCTDPNSITLGEAFDRMQREPSLFPVNLFYTCYASRDFRLNSPLPLAHG
jgi:hypothetical protein